MAELEIKEVTPVDRDLHALIEKLDEDLLRRYPAQGIFGVDFSDPKVKEMTFCVAFMDGKPAGCGGLRPLGDGVAELKRMYVEPEYRGRGVASVIVKYIEGKAVERGFVLMKLETGPKQPEAIGLYSKHGYKHIEAYGEYAGCVHSFCMEKELGV
jgi:GNAT superfamily N-acetyltransferase